MLLRFPGRGGAETVVRAHPGGHFVNAPAFTPQPATPMPPSPALLLLLPYVLSTAISAAVAAYCWRRRARPGVAAFAVVAASEAFWTLGFLFELASPGLRGKLFWDNLQYLPRGADPGGLPGLCARIQRPRRRATRAACTPRWRCRCWPSRRWRSRTRCTG